MRVHLVDGTYELFRAFYSHRPPHSSPSGKDLKGTLGVVQSLLGLLQEKDERCTHVAVAFDNPIVSFRNRLFAGYKTDAGIDPALRNQFDDVEAGVRALGVTVWSMKEFEADDALAAGAVKYAADARVEQVRICTPDKDLAQVLEGERIVQLDRMRKKLITVETVWAEKHLRPASVPDFLALVGDDADGIPGLEGWGAKSTAEVLAVHPHLEDIPLNVSEWKAKPRGVEKLSASLSRERENAMLYRTLATLRRDVPLKETLEDLEWKGVDDAVWNKWCDDVGTDSIRARPKRRRP
ncbi:MAG: 5'-3' exonuclease H3TH domain-containing protein [Archangium sp.]